MPEFIVHEPGLVDPDYKVAILINDRYMKKDELEKHYINPLIAMGNKKADFITFSLGYCDKKTPIAKCMLEECTDLLPKIRHLGITHLLVADAAYFKHLGKIKKNATAHLGYAVPLLKYPDFPEITAVLTPNFHSLFYTPTNQYKIDKALITVNDAIHGTYTPPGVDIIHSAAYPDSFVDISLHLKKLHKHPNISCDIETFSLAIDKAGLGTIAFAWDEHNGFAFAIEHDNEDHEKQSLIRAELADFFDTYSGNITYHNGSFDIKILIYELWMMNIDDIEGLLQGLDIMTKNVDDTQIIAYLATNTTSENPLSLKDLAQEFAGNYAQDDIKDITLIPQPKLLEYNLVDCLSTNYVKKKYYQKMCDDKQLGIYRNIMLPSQKVLIQTELSGMPMSMDNILKTEEDLNALIWKHENNLNSSKVIMKFEDWLRDKTREEANAKLKVKVKPLQDFVNVEFNPGSGNQIGMLLHDFIGLEVLNTTPTGKPATGADDLIALINELKREYIKE